MSQPSLYADLPEVRFEGPQSTNPLAYRWYDPQRIVLGKPLAEHLRPAVCYWHTFCWGGQDPFALGGNLFERPWFQGEPQAAAEMKLEAAFDFFVRLGMPFWCFHDRDVAPEGATLAESHRRLDAVLERAQRKMADTGVRLLWGTANLFSHPRYMSGAATNPDPEVFAYAAAQVKHVLEWTHRLGGANYVMWGGREGYETLLNTDMKRELDQYGRFLAAVVEHKHKIGFGGTLLIEPKPQEPTKHQYDHDAATVYGFLRRYGLEAEVKLNLEVLDSWQLVLVSTLVAPVRVAPMRVVLALAVQAQAGMRRVLAFVRPLLVWPEKQKKRFTVTSTPKDSLPA